MTKLRIAVFVSAVLVCISLGVAGWRTITQNELYSRVFMNTYPAAAVEAIWVAYRDTVQKDGRTLDRDRNYLTTSEGQSYSLLRAVWMDDRETFDRVLKWTRNNLQKREGDRLFAWLWGEGADGRWGVLGEEGGRNSASDADQDIALALIFASARWNDDYYHELALDILADIWRKEVVVVGGRPYLVAGNWAHDEERPTINPSYFSPAAYTVFASVDRAHDWETLKTTSYEVLERSTWGALDRQGTVGLPPDWVGIDRMSGRITESAHADKTTNFSDDAFRVLWRVALDWQWNRDPRALEYLSKLTFFKSEWEKRGLIYGTYGHDGSVVKDTESSSAYGALLAYFAITDPRLAQELYEKKIARFYDVDAERLQPYLGYYPQNWVWFGMAFYANKLPDLTKSQ